MHKIALCAGLCLGLAALSGCSGDDAATAPASESPAAATPVRVACVGDSNTAGYGATSYTVYLAETLGETYTVANYGVSGTTAMHSGSYPYSETAAYAESLADGADIVVLMLGTNDTACWRGSDIFADEYAALVDTYLALDPTPRLILCTPPAPDTSEWDSNTVSFGVQPAAYTAINDTICALAQRHDLPLIDIYQITDGHPDWYLDDGIHLANAGAQAVAAAVADTIASLD